MNSRFSGSSGFGSWFGNDAVGLEEAAARRSIGSRSSTGGSIAPAIPFAASITTRSGRIAVDVDEREHAVDVRRPDVLAPDRRRRDRPGAGTGQGPVADVEEARVAADGQRAAADDLHPRVLLRVVRGGDGDAAVEPELADREVEHLRADQPEVEDVGARGRGALDHRRRHRRRGERMSRPTAMRSRLELLDVGAPDRVRAVLVELVRIDAAHVVRLEDLRVEHRG